MTCTTLINATNRLDKALKLAIKVDKKTKESQPGIHLLIKSLNEDILTEEILNDITKGYFEIEKKFFEGFFDILQNCDIFTYFQDEPIKQDITLEKLEWEEDLTREMLLNLVFSQKSNKPMYLFRFSYSIPI